MKFSKIWQKQMHAKALSLPKTPNLRPHKQMLVVRRSTQFDQGLVTFLRLPRSKNLNTKAAAEMPSFASSDTKENPNSHLKFLLNDVIDRSAVCAFPSIRFTAGRRASGPT